MTAKKQSLPSRRPAETTSLVAGAVAFLVCRVAKIDDPTTLGAVTIVVGAIPAGVTWLVETVRR